MDLSQVAHALQRASTVPTAVEVLLHFNNPLSEKEATQLREFRQLQREQLEGGLKVEEPSAEVIALAHRPIKGFHPLQVIQCVLSATRLPAVQPGHHGRLRKEVLPRVAALTPLSFVEWCTAVSAVGSVCLQYFDSTPASLLCAEEVLRLAAPVIFNISPASAPSAKGASAWRKPGLVVQPRKDSATPKLKEYSPEEGMQLYLKTLAVLVQRCAAFHAQGKKHSLKDQPVKDECFFYSAAVRHLRRLMQATAGRRMEAVRTAVKGLSPVDLLSLTPVFQGENMQLGVTKDQISSAVKARPLTVFQVFGARRPVAGTLKLENADVALQSVLYNMGLTSTTRDAFLDYVNVLASAPTAQVAAYVAAKGKDALTQLITPFTVNADALAPVVDTVGPIYAKLFQQLHVAQSATLLTVLLQTVVFAVGTRCRTPREKEVAMRLLCDMVVALPAEATAHVEPTADLVTTLSREVAMPAVESAAQAFRLAAALHLEASLEDGLAEALKNSRREEAIRRALLVHVDAHRTPSAVVDGLITELLKDCEEVVVARPDAYLSLPFSLARGDHATVAKLCPLLSTAEVLRQLEGSVYEKTRAAQVAIELANNGYGAPLVQLLTSDHGLVRRPLLAYVKSVANDASRVTMLWNSMVQCVFGLEAPTQPAIVGSTAAPALVALGTVLLQHTSRLSVPFALSELLMCAGHDNVQGEDPYFYKASSCLLRRYRQGSLTVLERPLRQVLASGEGQEGLLSLHAKAMARTMLAALHKTVEHVSIAAARGFVLLLTQTTPVASREVYLALAEAVATSKEWFLTLSPEDVAIAAEDVDVMDAYETASLREQQLLKTYPDRPPKGVSEDDFHDMKKKDGIALAKGREVLRTGVEKRTKVLIPAVHQHKAAYFTLRLLGTHGHFDLEALPIFFGPLQATVTELQTQEKPTHVLAVLATDALAGLLTHTAFGFMAENVVRIVARLTPLKTLAVEDVSQLSVMAHALRQSLTQMLPAPLSVVLTSFASAAFKAGRGANAVSTTIPVATQHQVLGMLMQNIGQPNLPNPTATMELLTTILQSFPALYKSLQQGFYTLMAMVPSDRLPAVETGLFNTVDSVREVTAAAYSRFAHFETCRRALVLAETLRDDPSTNIAKAMRGVLDAAAEKYNFALRPSDWDDLVYFLRTYGDRSEANALRVTETMRQLFARRPGTDEGDQMQWVEELKTVGGAPSVIALEGLSSTYLGRVPAVVMDYLCQLLENPQTGETLLRQTLKAGRVVLEDADLTLLKSISPELQTRLAKPPKDVTQAHKEQYLATATVWLTIMSCRLQETALLEAIIDQQSRTLNNSQSAMVHRCVCESMADISRNPHIRASPKLDDFVEKCLKQCIHSGSYIKKKAHAWGLVGVIKGLGLTSMQRYNVMGILRKSAQGKQVERSGVMVLLEVLCSEMATLFEPYALSMATELLEAVADPDPNVSECADDAAKELMAKLSGVGLRQLIPRLVEGLASDSAKKRVPPLNFIGYVAFCSPKQLAAALPEIMKHIRGCLFDVNNAVSVAASNALRRVAGVVSNPEIQEHVELILNAMRSPSAETESALDALLYTRFINMVDPASLALIIPVLSRGLAAQVSHTRPKAAQIVAAMVNLVNDPRALLPYTDELVRLLEDASQDPSTEARTTAAKAAAALASAIGGNLIDEICQWAFGVLQRVQSGTIEKAGAAQVFVEVVNACGANLLQLYFPIIESGMTDERPPVREGFLYIMVYAPSTLSTESFQDFLPIGLPWVLEGLSHFSDKVRDVSLAAGDSIVSLYGTRNLELVLGPLLDGVTSEVTTLRQSSLQLSAKLMLHLVAHIKKKMRIQMAMADADAETRAELANMVEGEGEEGGASPSGNSAADDGDDGAVLTMEAARDVEKRGVSILGSLEEMLGTDNLVRMLAALFCGRHEHNATVRTDANMAWQACVASIRAAVNKIFDGLAVLLVRFASSDNPDCVEIAEKTIEFTTRMNETIERFVDSFCNMYKSENRRLKLGSLVCLGTVVQFADPRRLVSMGGQIVGCVLPGMQEHDAVQDAAREVFARVSKLVGPRLIESAVEAQLTTSVRGVVEVVKVKPGMALALVFKHLNALMTHTNQNVELLDAVLDVEEAEDELRRYSEDMVRLLLQFCVEDLDDAQELVTKYVEMTPREFEAMPIEAFNKAMNVPSRRHGALMMATAYGLGTDLDNVEGIAAVFRAFIDALGDHSDQTRGLAVQSISDLLNSLEERVLETLDEEERQDVMTSKRAAGRYLLQYLHVFQTTLAVTARAFSGSSSSPEFAVLGEGEPRLFDVLMTFYNRGLDYGAPQQKVEAVECIQDLMQFAPRTISAAAANTVAGRCSKVLFTRNEGAVVLVLVRLCLQLMNYPASGKEKMVEGTMALAMFNAALCDSGEARVLALRVVMQLLTRSEKYADLILGTVVTKKTAVDSTLLRTVMCRFISVVLRYAHFTKKFPHITKLMDMVRPMWEAPESPALAAAAGVAVGALCMSESIPDEVVGDIKERALSNTMTKGTHVIAGYALVYSLITCAGQRTDQAFLSATAEHLRAAAGFGAADKLTSMWMMRAAAAVASTGCVPQATFKVEAYVPLLRRVNTADDQLMSSAQYFQDCLVKAYPSAASLVEGMPGEPSSQWNTTGVFDADLDDEMEADVTL
ncbi:hypothetical protein ABB37_06163 [Leptomonas pyrrhocoris]|uniref:TOG domain-containing protein n=1 Tax=Leptomonas pyrrhocoris TaxID=157538 RepID=A0A0M9FYH2_LEPPY|nr:hypothetical protein ABB37_06163 [Leptomonas pyrrhocoris]KPA78563.1 hypothetical protein ABB37_06163 [Leptomonas pyrrhocoris]|eukprot:XP_015657002.1 hypothetical protein ABB37_06163 [Leptomonas pyrrhocoris]